MMMLHLLFFSSPHAVLVLVLDFLAVSQRSCYDIHKSPVMCRYLCSFSWTWCVGNLSAWCCNFLSTPNLSSSGWWELKRSNGLCMSESCILECGVSCPLPCVWHSPKKSSCCSWCPLAWTWCCCPLIRFVLWRFAPPVHGTALLLSVLTPCCTESRWCSDGGPTVSKSGLVWGWFYCQGFYLVGGL